MPPATPGAGGPSVLRREEMHGGDGASLIARAHALNHFIDMQAAASAAGSPDAPPRAPPRAAPREPEPAPGCLCFGGGAAAPPPHRGNLGGVGEARRAAAARAPRAYYPDNLAAQPERHPWEAGMEWVIVGCVDFLEVHGLDEPNLFAVSAVDDLVRGLTLKLGAPLPPDTDPHVASGAIKARVRHATEPLVPKACLRRYIEATAAADEPGAGKGGEYADTHLGRTVAAVWEEVSARRAYVFARFLRLLGRVSANEQSSRMNAHCLAKCVAPSMLHWDPNSQYALLMLGKITGYVMAMISEARVNDQALCEVIDELERAARAERAPPQPQPAPGPARASRRV